MAILSFAELHSMFLSFAFYIPLFLLIFMSIFYTTLNKNAIVFIVCNIIVIFHVIFNIDKFMIKIYILTYIIKI